MGIRAMLLVRRNTSTFPSRSCPIVNVLRFDLFEEERIECVIHCKYSQHKHKRIGSEDSIQ